MPERPLAGICPALCGERVLGGLARRPHRARVGHLRTECSTRDRLGCHTANLGPMMGGIRVDIMERWRWATVPTG
jgi:hypothetical protein